MKISWISHIQEVFSHYSKCLMDNFIRSCAYAQTKVKVTVNPTNSTRNIKPKASESELE